MRFWSVSSPIGLGSCRRRVSMMLLTAIGLLFAIDESKAGAIEATQNLAMDPLGRIVDVTFDQNLTTTAPWDRFRFDINMVQPLARGGGAFLAELTGDGVPDLVLADFGGRRLFFPGVAGNPRQFGDGFYLKEMHTDPTLDPFQDHEQGALWVTGAVGDLDIDGKQDLVIGQRIYDNVGTPQEPKLEFKQVLAGAGGSWDSAPSLGDLNGDGKLDVVIAYNYANGGLYVYWNNSTPNALNFSREFLYRWPFGQAPANRLAVGDLNGDGKLDLAGGAGIYFNSGTPQTPSFDFSHPSSWNIAGSDGLWIPDEGINLSLIDVTGDGLLDAYVSGLSTTMWQVLFFRNTGTATAHRFQYEGPVLASSTPLNIYERGFTTPTFSGNRAFVATGDIDQNGLPDIALSTGRVLGLGKPTILWNFATSTGQIFSYQDIYTYPGFGPEKYINSFGTLGKDSFSDFIYDHLIYSSSFASSINSGRLWSGADALSHPLETLSAWIDLTGDSLPDGVRWEKRFDHRLFLNTRIGSWPFRLSPDSLLLASSTPFNGTAFVDIDLDGRRDLVAGSDDGKLWYYRNTGSGNSVAFSDPVPLTDSIGNPIDVGNQSWPTAIDLDGDGDLDFLVAQYKGFEGKIHKVICSAPGQVNGYSLGSPLGTPEQDPVNLLHVAGGGTLCPSLATIDIEGDGLHDVVLGSDEGRVWLLHNKGTSSTPEFHLKPLMVSRTSAAYMEQLDSRRVRLYFALPTIPGKTVLGYHEIPTANNALSGEVTIEPDLGRPIFSESTNSLIYDDTRVGLKNKRVLTISNSGSANLVVSGVSVTGTDAPQFSVSPTTATIAPGGNETLTVTFTPTSAGQKSAVLSISHNAAGSPTTIALSGTGTGVASITLSTTSLTLDETRVGSSSQKVLTLSNPGSDNLMVSGISVIGRDAVQFSVSLTTATIAPGGNQTLTVTFTPTSAGQKSAVLSISHNATGSPSTIPLSGTGVGVASITLSVSSLTLDSTRVGSSSQKVLTISNPGSGSLVVSGLSVAGTDAGQFAVSPPTATIAPGGSQTVTVTFTPSSAGVKSADLSIAYNAAGSPSTIPLSGTGAGVASINLSVSSLTMDSTRVGSSSQKTLTLSNPGSGSLVVSGLSVTGADAGQFQVSPPTATIAPGASQTITVTFTPISAGGKSASLSLAHNAAGSPTVVALSGTGAGVASITLSLSSLVMDSTRVGSSSQKTLTISNPGSGSLVVSGLSVTGSDAGQFQVSPPTATVAPGASQTVTVTFTPTSAGVKSAALSIAYNAAGSPSTIPLSGTGAGVASITLSFSSLAMDSTKVGSSSQKTLAIGNPGSGSLVVTGISVTGSDAGQFQVSPTTATIAPGGSQTVTVIFTPSSAGVKSASLSIAYNAAGSPSTIPLSGTGVGVASITLSVSSLTLDSTRVGSSSQKTLTISNPGSGSLVVSGISVTGTDAGQFQVSPPTVTIAAGGSQTVTVTFAPTSVGVKSASLSIAYNAAGSPATVALSGNSVGGGSSISLSVGSLVMDSTRVGSSSQKTFTITNNSSGGAAPPPPGAGPAVSPPSFARWVRSADAKDLNGDRKIDRKDYDLFVAQLAGGGTASPPTGGTLSISRIRVTGVDSAQFTVSPATATLAPGASQTFTVTFAPTSAGAKSAALSIAHNAAGSPTTLNLSGRAIQVAGPPVLVASVQSLTFDTTKVGNTSQQSFTVTNTGGRPLSITGITKTGSAASQFQVSPTTATVAASGSQIFTVSFSPTSTGTKRATLSIAHNAAGSPTTINLSGPAVQASGPAVFASSVSSLTFDSTRVGSTSQKRFTISNTGGRSLSIAGINRTGSAASQFQVSPTTATIAAGGSQSFTVKFSPTSAGTKRASLSIAHNAAGSPTTISLTGPVVQAASPPVFVASVKSLTFDNTSVGGTSQKSFTVSNTGGQSLSITRISKTGSAASQFQVSPTTATIAAGGSQSFTVSFSPTSVGTKRASLSLAHNAAGSPTTISLTGTATAAVGKAVTRTLPGALTSSDPVFSDADRQYDDYVVNLRAGQKLSLSISATADISFEGIIDGQSGEYIDGQPSAFRRLDNLLIPQDGIYTIRVSGDRVGVTGSYTITVTVTPGPLDIGPASKPVVADAGAKVVRAKTPLKSSGSHASAGGSIAPDQFALEPNFPNPFNPETTIRYQLPTSAQVRLEIYDLLGQKVRTLVSQVQEVGYYRVVWDGRDDGGNSAASAVYFYRLQAGAFGETRKLLLMR